MKEHTFDDDDEMKREQSDEDLVRCEIYGFTLPKALVLCLKSIENIEKNVSSYMWAINVNLMTDATSPVIDALDLS